MKRQAVITGLGVVSPIGNDLVTFRKNLFEGRSGLAPIQSFDVSNFPVKVAFEIKNFNAHAHRTHLLDPFIQYAVAAASEAIQHARFDPEQYDPYRIGISVSSSKGGVHTIDRFKDRFEKNRSAILGARIYTNSVPNFASQWIARRWKIQGPAKCYVAACATGTVSIIEGARMVSEGIVDYCIAGASDASIVPLMLAGYRNMKALAKEQIRPFDRRRDGFQVGEGAGIVLIETEENARARGAKIYAKILGSAYQSHSEDAFCFDQGDALSRGIQMAMERSGIDGKDLDYISLHGTGTKAGDLYETLQLKKAFGKKAYDIPMSSIKSMVGHMLGAAGAVEIIACALAMEEQKVPATAGLEKRDPLCDLDYVPQKARAVKVRNCLTQSMGFGGHIVTLLLGKPE